ncbi:MAG: hypothetical protein JXQ27_08950 [Acidobacteria bacterium]|nr:hypothetical protein [Acidobacteriota bacterium]
MAAGAAITLDPVEIGRRLAAADVAVLDVDGCMYPGYTQITLGHRLLNGFLRRELRHPPSSLFLWRLAAKGGYLYWIRFWIRKPERRNYLLQKHYALAFDGITRTDIRAILPRVWKKLDTHVHPCLAFLADRLPLGIISLGLDVILDGLPEHLRRHHQAVRFLFCCSNRIIWNDGHFAGLVPPIRVGAADKADLFHTAAERHRVGIPLVIGHNSEERELCRLAAQRGGLSIGMNPAAGDRDAFDVVIEDGSWKTLHSFLRENWPSG